MNRTILNNRCTKLVVGLGAGLLMIAVPAAVVLYFGGYVERARVQWLETKLHAAAAQSGTSLCVATGPIEQGVEGIFVLDFISGELSCGVMNPRTGQISGLFRRNITADAGVAQGKQPKYMLATWMLAVLGLATNDRPSLSLCYVADSTSCRYMAYILPWNTQVASQNRTVVQTFRPIGGGSARNLPVEVAP